MRFQLTPADRDGLYDLWRRMRAASAKANDASATWNRVNDELNDLAERSGWDDLKTAKVKAANMRLTDAFGAWSFWEREVSRLALTLQAEYAARTMFGLVDADEPDETGLFYQRDDEGDEPVRRPTKPHVGFSVISPGRAEQAARRRSNSPAGPSVGGRPRQSPGRPGPQPSGARAGARASGPGGTGATGPVPPALRGGGAW
ncbi:hypothetical protein ACIBJE_02295 [Micromonospora sp. NPDC050187]|uniref:hypothetical protein n=1 Tax=Micromonospora sp. NPDC050187 TaxID=3364277 RepID=UPI0037898AF3